MGEKNPDVNNDVLMGLSEGAFRKYEEADAEVERAPLPPCACWPATDCFLPPTPENEETPEDGSASG
jgi:hypothetical protein